MCRLIKKTLSLLIKVHVYNTFRGNIRFYVKNLIKTHAKYNNSL